MTKCAILCGTAPEDYRQKKLVEMQDFLESAEGGSYEPGSIIVFPNGVKELFLEGTLNSAFDNVSEEEAQGEVLLYMHQTYRRQKRDDERCRGRVRSSASW